ncbi:hypothetical protein C5167_015172 [Papaver somniferum]|uniref:Uncharacterized protein n=1 Tax=Papaver somniferum TaxID=3469 RepID=A0A4Y7J668_PAPSO|nr:hypothetical protein C5167_015172 [Papaver somniferum]
MLLISNSKTDEIRVEVRTMKILGGIPAPSNFGDDWKRRTQGCWVVFLLLQTLEKIGNVVLRDGKRADCDVGPWRGAASC